MNKNSFYLIHFPTVALILGYVVFWFELYAVKTQGNSTVLAAGSLTVLFFLLVCINFRYIRSGTHYIFGLIWKRQDPLLLAVAVISGCMLLVGFYASLYPPHLPQESDALMYHITLPRQHLLKGDFTHIQWSTADFYLLPVQFALSPYWLVTDLPNKVPQFLVYLWLLGMVYRLAYRFSRKEHTAALLAVCMVMASHVVTIQLGTAMLDVVLAYLILAALDSFLSKRYGLAGIELGIYFWAKSFIPVQMLLIVVFMVLVVKGLSLFGTKGLTLVNGYASEKPAGGVAWKRFILFFVLTSLLAGGPFVVKNLYYTGTPLFPFFTGALKVSGHVNNGTPHWNSIMDKSEKVLATKDQYGSGRSVSDFLTHLIMIAIPEKGVNNRYDYPVGLVYLLCLIPFLHAFISAVRRGKLPFIPVFVISFWATWWAGTHQSRFLIVPLILIILCVTADKVYRTKVFQMCVVLALLIECISVVRAHKASLFKQPHEVLREKDKALVRLSKSNLEGQLRVLNYPDVAFAGFPVAVENSDSVFALKE